MMEIKRFEILPIVKDIRLNHKLNIRITSVDVNNNDLYLGTVDSFILHYANSLNLSEHSSSITTNYKYLGLKKAIYQIKVAFVLNRLIFICDSTLFALNLDNLEVVGSLKMKNISTFCLNENPINLDPFCLEVCVAKKRSISICLLQSDKMTTVKEVNVPEQPTSMSMDGYFVCMSSDKNYYMINWQSGNHQLLCSNDNDSLLSPICKHVSRNEFLINGISHLGVFVKTTGISERPPIDWGTDVRRIAYSYPYILCLKHYSILIFSVIDQQLKEELIFENGIYIDNFDGKIVLTSNDSVYFLRRIPFEEQIDSLLDNGKSQEAIDLCHSLYESGMISNTDIDYAKLVKIKAGLFELIRGNSFLAQQFLIESDFDIKLLLSCYQNLTKYLTIQFDESDIIVNKIKHILENVKAKFSLDSSFNSRFLVEYIRENILQKSSDSTNDVSLVNTALLLLYLEDISNYFALIESFFFSDHQYDFKLIEKYLDDNKLYHLLALFYSSRVDYYENAIDLWKKLEKGFIVDSNYNGLNNFCNIFMRCQNSKLILNHVEFLLERDQTKGASVLIENTKMEGDRFTILNPDTVINMLHKYRKALIIYLEYLVFTVNIKTSQIHTSLAIIYIEIISIQRESEEGDSTFCESINQKLKNLLHSSDSYDKKTILSSLIQNNLDYETALIYGKIGDHRKAFEIYIHKYMDHCQALQHCLDYESTQVNIYSILFNVYLDIYSKNGPEVMQPMLMFLNNSQCQFRLGLTLQELPLDWPLKIINRHISKSIATTFNHKFKSSFAKVLALSQLERFKNEKRIVMSKPIVVNKDSVCIICNDKLLDSKFVWIPASECYLHDYCFRTST